MRPFALLLVVAPLLLSAQSASLTYRLGKDTLAVEQYTRAATGITGEMVQRNGPAIARLAYSVTLGRDGRPAAAPSFVETFTIAVRAFGGPRGVLELSWGDRVMSAPFTVSVAR